jgi:hypothetical protein
LQAKLKRCKTEGESKELNDLPERQREREGCRKVPYSHCPAFFHPRKYLSSMDVVKVLK